MIGRDVKNENYGRINLIEKKPKNECGKGCYSCSWESDLYLCFAEERSEVYCDYSVHR